MPKCHHELVPDPGHHTYVGDDRADVVVEVDGAWYSGELPRGTRPVDGSWSGIVTWWPRADEVRMDRLGLPRVQLTPCL